MEYAIIFIGILAIGCTCVLFMTINVHSAKLSELQKVIAQLHFKVLNVESDVNIAKKQRVQTRRTNYSGHREPCVKREVVYKVPKKISGDLIMDHRGKSACVKAVFKVKDTE
jgi:hypothetical protein